MSRLSDRPETRFPRAARSRGASLLEALVAVLLFAIGVVPVFDMIRRSTQLVAFSREEVIARAAAGELVDQVAAMPFRWIPLREEHPRPNADDGVRLHPDRPETRLTLTPLPEPFGRFLTIAAVPGTTRLKTVKARVSWGRSPAHQVVMEAVVEWQP